MGMVMAYGDSWGLPLETANIRRTLALAGNSGTQDCNNSTRRYRQSQAVAAGRVPPRPCRNPALRYGLRRGMGRTAHSAIGTRYGGSRGASAALDPGLRPFAYAGSAPLPWRHQSRLRQRRVSPLVRYACTLVLPMPHYASQACRYHSIAAGGRCCLHTPLRLCLRERFTLQMPCS